MKTASIPITFITKTALLLGITLAFQMMALPQFVTGPAVNAMLILSTIAVGYKSAMTIGALTPVIAFLRGILAPPLGPAIPFIVLGNWLYILIYNFLETTNKLMAVILASLAKFAILAVAVSLIIDVPPQVAQMLQVPQLITALAGGLVALLVAPALNKSLQAISSK